MSVECPPHDGSQVSLPDADGDAIEEKEEAGGEAELAERGKVARTFTTTTNQRIKEVYAQTQSAIRKDLDLATTILSNEIRNSRNWPQSHLYEVSLELSPMLAYLLGLKKEQGRHFSITNENIAYPIDEGMVNSDMLYCQRPVSEIDLYQGCPTDILLSCNLVESTHVGDIQLPLLQHIHLGDEARKYNPTDPLLHLDYTADSWKRISTKSFSRFEVKFTDLKGVPIRLSERPNQPTLLQLAFVRLK